MADHHFTVGRPETKITAKTTKKKTANKKTRNGLKVVYISSPMKFNTCASKFRALVQELTGKDSDAAAQFMDPIEEAEGRPAAYGGHEDHGFLGFGGDRMINYDHDQYHEENHESPTCTSNSDDHSVFDEGNSLMEGMSFLDMFTSSLLNESSHLDFLRAN